VGSAGRAIHRASGHRTEDRCRVGTAWERHSLQTKGVRMRTTPSAKVCVSIGELAFFQKAFETEPDEWSAEGEPFVISARLEAAVPSTKRINFLAREYDHLFAKTSNVASPYGSAFWEIVRDSIQVPGLGLAGGWEDIVYLGPK